MKNGARNPIRFNIIIFFLILLHGGFGIQELQSAITTGKKTFDPDILQDLQCAIARATREKAVGPSRLDQDIKRRLAANEKGIQALMTLPRTIEKMLGEETQQALLLDWSTKIEESVKIVQRMGTPSLRGKIEDALIQIALSIDEPVIQISFADGIQKTYLATRFRHAENVIKILVDYINAAPEKRAAVLERLDQLTMLLSDIKKHVISAVNALDNYTKQKSQNAFFSIVLEEKLHPDILRAIGKKFIAQVLEKKSIEEGSEQGFILQLVEADALSTKQHAQLEILISDLAKQSGRDQERYQYLLEDFRSKAEKIAQIAQMRDAILKEKKKRRPSLPTPPRETKAPSQLRRPTM
ncbi:MAG: hypothetical protein WCW33_05130 [Candidatus Babeliales bacterium]|jgi:hypothetical protein